MSNTPLNPIVAGLRAWAGTHDFPIRAAVELLIKQGHWLCDSGFVTNYVHIDSDGWVWIDWYAVGDAINNNWIGGSSGELAVLRFAASLARDSLGLSSLDHTNRQLVVRALADALGVE